MAFTRLKCFYRSTRNAALSQTEFELIKERTGHHCPFCEDFHKLSENRLYRSLHNLVAVMETIETEQKKDSESIASLIEWKSNRYYGLFRRYILASEFVFHIRNAHSGDLAAALAVIEAQPGLNTIAEIVDQAETMGFTIRDRQRFEALMTAKDLELIGNEQNTLTDKGQQLAILMNKPDLFGDIVHGLRLSLWDSSNPSINCFSWSYRAICRMFWINGTIEISD